VEVDIGHRARQLAVIDQTAPRREKLKTGFIGPGADRIEYGGYTATASVFANSLPHVRRSAIDDIVRAGCASVVHAFTGGDSDDIHSALGQNCNEHSTYRAGSAPDYG
jgi:hypothetical protein